jgi:hypothetical protein
MNMRGIRRQSILRKTRFASASCSASKWITSGAGCEAVISVCLEGSMVSNPGSTKVRKLVSKIATATDAEIYHLLHRSCGVTKHMRRNSFTTKAGSCCRGFISRAGNTIWESGEKQKWATLDLDEHTNPTKAPRYLRLLILISSAGAASGVCSDKWPTSEHLVFSHGRSSSLTEFLRVNERPRDISIYQEPPKGGTACPYRRHFNASPPMGIGAPQ